MAKSKTGGKTRRDQYDEILSAAYHKTCKDCAVLGFEFESESKREQFHYALMEYCIDKYKLFDGNGCRANVVTDKANAAEIRGIAGGFDGGEYRVQLDAEI